MSLQTLKTFGDLLKHEWNLHEQSGLNRRDVLALNGFN